VLPVQIWIMSRWFLPEDGNLFLSRFGGRKDSGGKCFCFGLAKDIGVLMVFFRNSGEVDFLGDSGGFGL